MCTELCQCKSCKKDVNTAQPDDDSEDSEDSDIDIDDYF